MVEKLPGRLHNEEDGHLGISDTLKSLRLASQVPERVRTIVSTTSPLLLTAGLLSLPRAESSLWSLRLPRPSVASLQCCLLPPLSRQWVVVDGLGPIDLPLSSIVVQLRLLGMLSRLLGWRV